MIIQELDMTGYHTGWLDHSEYLQARTPLTERQADVLAMWKTGQSLDEISDTLGLPADRVEDYWSDILDQWDRAQELCTVLGPQPWDDGETRQPDAIDDTTWNLLASTAKNESDEDRTRVELELYFGHWGMFDPTYLFVEREIKDVDDYATETKIKRGAYGPDALRDNIYEDVNTIDEFYLRYVLLEKSGIDPGADYAPHPEDVLDRDVSRADMDAAREQALDRVVRHTVE